MSVICIVQARHGSTRFPGKVLAELDGKPLLAFLLGRLAPLEFPVVVATSHGAADDAVADVAAGVGVPVVRGPEDDVLARFLAVLDAYPADRVVRVTGDCPLVDPSVIALALSVAVDTGADYVSNTLVRTFPDGLDVEVVDANTLRHAGAESADPVEREHVTPFVYRRPERFSLRTFRSGGAFGDLRWTVDSPADLEAVRGIVDRLGRADFSWEEALGVVPPVGAPGAGLRVVPAKATDAAFLLALRNDPESVRWSRSPRPVTPAEHRDWFERVLESPARRVWVGWHGTEPIGTVRVDVTEGVGLVSIAVDPAWRGRGLAAQFLEALMSVLDGDEQIHTLVAEIHADHEASRRVFAAAGFSETGRDGAFVITRRSRSRHA